MVIERLTNEQFRDLRRRTEFSQTAVAERLGYTTRAIAGWEAGPPKGRRSLPETQVICRLFWQGILSERVKRHLETAFKKIPSELVALWLVRGSEAVVSPWSARLQSVKEATDEETLDPNPALPFSEVVCSLSLKKSMTASPLRLARLVNSTGDDIKFHPAKGQRGTRSAQYLSGGLVESLLHVPVFRAGAVGPIPILLLSLQNKLTGPKGMTINSVEFRKKHGKKANIYTADDERVATELADAFAADLADDLELLGMGWAAP
jgi:transcriptional regulator with XRE-family HTH domain